MRLIDADLLKESVAKWLKSYKPDETETIKLACVLESVVEEINEQPTAFDVDKVMEQLKRKESVARSELLVDRKTAFEFSSKCRLEAYEEAIEIVKGGGTE